MFDKPVAYKMALNPRKESSDAVSQIITAIIPCFNQGKYLKRAVVSVFAQQDVPVEVVVIDDGSTDETPEICTELRKVYPHMRYARKKNAGSVANARNFGMAFASGDFINFLDADDYIAPNMYSMAWSILSKNSNIDIVFTGYEMVSETGSVETIINAPTITDFRHDILVSNRFPIHSHIFRRAAFEDSLPFDETLLNCEDWDLLIRLAMNGARIKSIPDSLVSYVQYSNSKSKNYLKMIRAGMQILEKQRIAVRGSPRLELARESGLVNLRHGVFKSIAAPQLALFWHERSWSRFWQAFSEIWLHDAGSRGLLAEWLLMRARQRLQGFAGLKQGQLLG